MKFKILSFLFLFITLVACNKEEQSCSDGIFQPEYEEELDCGGVCPPCNYTPAPISDFVIAKINDSMYSFPNFQLENQPNWILKFGNDSIEVQINFGPVMDTTTALDVIAPNSYALINSVSYTNLVDGKVLISEVDSANQTLSGYFQVEWVADFNNYDTLLVSGGEFRNLNWGE